MRNAKGKRVFRIIALIASIPPIILILILAGYGGKRAVERYLQRLPETQAENWHQLLESRKHELASRPWKDSRPLTILAGDSHIEMGRWYEAFQGAHAVRNCGLSRSKISDVAALVEKIGDPKIHTILLHCGINDLLGGASPAKCAEDYVKLLDAAHALHPSRVIVSGVMPVRQSPVDGWSPDTNARVNRFNDLLEAECSSRGITFVNPYDTVASPAGGLNTEYTFDGLHLNTRGYTALSPLFLEALKPSP